MTPVGAGAPVAIVTGASRGIGAHLATALEGAGYAVERGSRAVAEVTDRAAVDRWVSDIVARHGRIDLLVNNAGVIDAEVPLLESDPDEWWQTVEVNLRGPYLVTRAVLPHLVAAGSGRIVNINSGAAYHNGDAATAYNVSKEALARLTAATSLNVGRGVRAFDLAPGVVRTDMTQGAVAHRDRTEWTEPETVTQLLLALASGELDAWNGRLVRAGVDTPASLQERAAAGLPEAARTLGLIRWGGDDPLS
ncbi:SDR family NAD(P)-dependent oxidoreductase [Nostocoides sp. HKS02]|uniref:SDR family NAD(P)-dependent oxidoreductase n=1 Tax=Nostocoides sp. HKS02 TaxID=1813880 RepID=UPI0012B4EB28|nr:SDR family NAD(P)-dependent oxidoreductase [Tetrasphaera sp. HKS02]QGN57056.1 SDR family NAD(P)-dependent oxidoreductase [Tetrasphaera sp. HKS02]